MNVVFRSDASLDIGTGHVMRCLTLADALRERGAQCRFICRAHAGHLATLIEQHGHVVTLLPLADTPSSLVTVDGAAQPAHITWLGTGITQEADARDTMAAIGAATVDWLIVDHYALDSRWENLLRSASQRLMIIDDLADRMHDCNLLLDQTFGRAAADYRSIVPANCRLLCGSQYALLRPEFAALRLYSLRRRATPVLRELLITMGGVDKDNATGQVLTALRSCMLPEEWRITVVMGATAPWLKEVEKQARDMPWATRVLVGVSDMARLMADSDLAIGAAGATSWERCCLGVPTIMLVLAENQRKIAQALSHAGAAFLVDVPTLREHQLVTPENLDSQVLGAMSAAAAATTDGSGVVQVIESLTDKVQYADQLSV